MFEGYNEKFIYTNADYLRKPNTVVGSIAALGSAKYEFPSTCSATDYGLEIPIKKMYSEHYERFCTGLALKSNKSIVCYDLVNHKLDKRELGSLAYGKSEFYGYVDTTGTGARDSLSSKIIEKAISELFEKNELFLFWYHKLGVPLNVDKNIKTYITQYGLDSLEPYFFKCNNLSSWPTIIAVFVRENHIVTTGISCNKDLNEAIHGAINEAKTLLVMNLLQFKLILDYDDYTHIATINYLRDFPRTNLNPTSEKLKQLSYCEIEIAEWINNIEVVFIGNYKQNYKAISVSSKQLMKCVPEKQKLIHCSMVELYKRYPVKNLEEYVECIIM